MAFPLSDEEHCRIRRRIEDRPELIVAAAIRWGDVVVMVERPGRHGNCIWPMHAAGLPHNDHGFLTSHGRFVDRLEAGKLVAETGQGSVRTNCNGHLFSEDMWNDTDTENADRCSRNHGPEHSTGSSAQEPDDGNGPNPNLSQGAL
jgi:hypothetical protein